MEHGLGVNRPVTVRINVFFLANNLIYNATLQLYTKIPYQGYQKSEVVITVHVDELVIGDYYIQG